MKKNLAKILVLVLLVGVLAACFTACVPTDYTKAKEKLIEAGYEDKMVVNDNFDADSMLVATISVYDDDDSEAYITYYKDAKVAKAAYKLMKESLDYEYDMAKYSHDVGEMSDSDWEEFKADHKAAKVSRNGKVVVYGSGAAYKAATK